jgi:superkiller protein 3
MSEYYYFIEEFEAGVETCRKALTLAARLKEEIGLELVMYASRMHLAGNDSGSLTFGRSSDSIRITLANCLVRYRAPRYFDEAQSLFDSVLERVPSSVPALVGKGHLLGEQEDYSRALKFFQAALAHESDNLMVNLEAAWYQALCGDYQGGLESLEECLSRVTGTDMRSRVLRARTLYRIGMCLWELDASPAARKSRAGAYARFLGALQADANFAPAYTSLGLYYADYARDKRRAQRCFLKAIELSASEILAAERLARGYADDSDWDLVELVAQRVVDSGKARPETAYKKKGTSWPYAALGIVQLNKQEFAKSIVSFQAALRIAPGDYNSWIGLGESYHNSGRYIAATKAFEQAQKVQGKASAKQSELWFAKFLSANVKRELGQFDGAVEDYTRVLADRPTEFGVLIALVQTLVEGAWHNIELGFFGRASENARTAISYCSRLVELQANAFNLWKALADASIMFSFIIGHVEKFPWALVQDLLNEMGESIDYDILSKVDGVGRQSLSKEVTETTSVVNLERCVHGAILAQKRSLATTATDAHARALAWYNLGWTEYRAHICLSADRQIGTNKRSSGYLKASIQCFKRAIETEARNSDFWNAFGVASSTVNPTVSQHAFVRSLFLNDKVIRGSYIIVYPLADLSCHSRVLVSGRTLVRSACCRATISLPTASSRERRRPTPNMPQHGTDKA